jgi:hypothetical protein
MSLAYVALLHYPVYNKHGEVVTTALTNMDIHDIARAAKTYAVRRFYVVTPVRALRVLGERVIDHWREGYGSTYNPSRKEALALVSVQESLDHTLLDVEQDAGRKPKLVVTSARPGGSRIPFAEMREILRTGMDPLLLVLGTGWGLAQEILEQSDYALEPIYGVGEYNHLSVRSAAAILMDRLCAAPWWQAITPSEDQNERHGQNRE